MFHRVIHHHRPRSTLLVASLSLAVLPLAGCNLSSSSSSSSGSDMLSGVFKDSRVSGLDYEGTETGAGITDEDGHFQYVEGETVTFSIGDLELGSAEGAEEINALSVTSDATSAEDERVNNRLILLQTLDVDGDLNNGIELSEAVRTEVSRHADSIDFDQPTTDFRESLEPVVEALEEGGAFTDPDPRPRAVTDASDALAHFVRSTSERVVMETAAGELRGFAADEDTWQFLGVPYAQPPLGDLRWRPPEEPEPWTGERDAIAWSDQAAQNPGLEQFGEGGMSEDSLYLNVTAPRDAEDLPVMVWFHGGGFTSLTGNTQPFNNPEALASKGVVQLSVNHRLGPFGYMAHSDLSTESGYGGSGNYGQMDLIMALEWVQENIEAFGGDPDNVTIFGNSGGGRKVLSLMASPEAAGLFHRAMSQSGTLRPDTRSLDDAEAIGEEVQSELGAESLDEMRERSWTEVVAAAEGVDPYTNVDNGYKPYTARETFESGNHHDVPFMFVINTNDTPEPTNTVVEVFPWMEPLSSSNHYAALFSHQPAGWRDRGVDAYHGAELAYMFNSPESVITHYLLDLVIDPATGESLEIGHLNGNGVSGSEGDPESILISAGFDATDAEVIDRMMTMWTNFARTGDPSISGEIEYPTYDGSVQQYVDLGAEAEVKEGLADEFVGDE